MHLSMFQQVQQYIQCGGGGGRGIEGEGGAGVEGAVYAPLESLRYVIQ